MPKTLNDIIPPSRRKDTPAVFPEPSMSSAPPASPSTPSYPRTSRRFPWGMVLVALGVIVVSGGILFLFSRAEVSVTPKENQVTVNASFTASLKSGDLPYQIVSVDRVDSESVPAEGTETVQIPAEGHLTIYNGQTTVQKLIKNTRFQAQDGHVFRTRESVSIPAAEAGLAGTITVAVSADEAGPAYNIGPSTFTIPGLKGSKSYALVDGKSADSMTGGFVGTRGTVSKAVANGKRTELDTKLDQELGVLLTTKIPDGYILLPGSSVLTHDLVSDAKITTDTVTIGEKGTMRAAVFPEEALARAIAYKTVGQYQGQALTLPDTKNLMVSFVADSGLWAGGVSTTTFSVKGDTTLVWKVIPGKIAGAVAGKTPDAAQVVLTSGGFTEVGVPSSFCVLSGGLRSQRTLLLST